MLLECPAFIHQRKPIYSQFKTKVIKCIGAQHWRELSNNRDSLINLYWIARAILSQKKSQNALNY